MSAIQARRRRLQQASDGLWPYRRDLSDIEAASGVDVPSLDHAQQETEEALTAAWAPLRRRAVEAIVSAVSDAATSHAPGDTSWVGSISIDVPDSAPLAVAMTYGIDLGRDLALDEAHRQSPALAERIAGFARPDHIERIRSYASGAIAILVGGLVQSASREAFRLTLTTDVDIPAAARAILGDLPMLYERDVFGGMACGAVNEGRYEVMTAVLGGSSPLLQAAEPVAALYALEILDGNTCDECAAIDGQEYFSIEAARLDYPGLGGGYVDCAGRDRCRGSLVIVYGDEATTRPEQLTPPAPKPRPAPKPAPPPAPPKPAPAARTDVRVLNSSGVSDDLLRDMFQSQAITDLGYSVKVKAAPFRDQATHITADILTPRGKSVGQISRFIDEPNRLARHDSFFLDPNMQGKGIATDFMRSHVSLYERLGIQEVEVDAAGSNGRYTWARFGFDFTVRSEREEMREHFHFRIRESLAEELGREVSIDEARRLAPIASRQIDDAAHAWDFAAIDVYEPRTGIALTGQEMMIGGPSWSGKLDLRQGTMSRRVLDEYLAR